MQNNYIGDSGDFAKYLFLKQLCKNDLSLGINWYLVDVEKGKDGRKTNEKLRLYDDELYSRLKILKNKEKVCIEDVKSANLFLCDSKYYPWVVPYHKTREAWFGVSLNEFRGSDIIFCDPDNGLMPAGCRETHNKSIKYTLPREIEQYFNQGSSVILYQQADRTKGGVDNLIAERKKQLNESGISIDLIQVIYVGKGIGIGLLFFVLMHPKHKVELTKRINSLPALYQIKYSN